MLRVIETQDRNQQWLGVADIMKAEAHEEANAALDKYADAAPTASPASRRSAWCARARPPDEILGLIEDDEDIAILVLAAGTGKDGPGPLVAELRQHRRRLSRSRSPSCRGT